MVSDEQLEKKFGLIVEFLQEHQDRIPRFPGKEARWSESLREKLRAKFLRGREIKHPTKPMTVTDDDGEAEKESVQMTATYNRLTKDGVVNHSATMMLGEDGETEADLAFVLTEEDGSYTLDGAMNEVDDGKEKPILTVKGVLNSADSKADGWLAMLADENQITFTYTGSTEGDQTERLVSLYARENAVAITELAASERPLFSLRVTTSENADDSVLKAIESATAENAVQPLQMSDDELTEYLTSISTNATQVLYTVLSKLPSSVIELLTATNGN